MKTMKAMTTAAVSIALLASLAACSPSDTPSPTPSSSSAAPSAPTVSETPADPAKPSEAPVAPTGGTAGTALAALESLPVSDFASNGKYERALFGEPWEDIDNNGCDTREDILKRDIPNVTIKGKCDARQGSFNDPYTGKVINFNADDGRGGGVDIDHIIPLSLGWKTGASEWDASKRLAFANDPLNLMASDAGENRKKGDKDASAYLPPNAAFHCEYVARQVTVRAKYGTWITPAEKNAIYTVLQKCPEQPLTEDVWGVKVSKSDPAVPAPAAEPVEEAPAAVPAPAVPAPAAGGTDPDYGSCAKAKAAGAGPYTADQPEYKFYRDGDGDGTVCE